jgi:hypothetical protein
MEFRVAPTGVLCVQGQRIPPEGANLPIDLWPTCILVDDVPRRADIPEMNLVAVEL